MVDLNAPVIGDRDDQLGSSIGGSLNILAAESVQAMATLFEGFGQNPLPDADDRLPLPALEDQLWML